MEWGVTKGSLFFFEIPFVVCTTIGSDKWQRKEINNLAAGNNFY